jgi:hypothetical protein
MNNPEGPGQNESAPVVDIDKASIAGFAHQCYLHEPGTKHAVDDGLMTMLELEIKHYLVAWVNANTPDCNGEWEDQERIWMAKLEEAYVVAAKVYSIDVNEARRTFEKVSEISRVDKK